MSKLKLVLWFVLPAVLFIVAFKVYSLRASGGENLYPVAPVFNVEGVEVRRGKLQIHRDFVGRLVPENRILISSSVGGYINRLSVKEGDKVSRGKELFEIDDYQVKQKLLAFERERDAISAQIDSLKARRKALESEYEFLKKKLKRNRALYKVGAISKEALEASELKLVKVESELESLESSLASLNAKLSSAQHRVEGQRHLLNYTKVVSPTDAMVGRVFLKEGSFLPPGKPVLELYRGKKLEITVPRELARRIKTGSEAELYVYDEVIIGRVEKIYPYSSKSLSIIEVLVEGDKLGSLPIGSELSVRLNLSVEEGYLLPEEAILTLSGGNFVVVNVDGNFSKIPVRILGKSESMVVVGSEALREGMVVAVGPQEFLKRALLSGKGNILLRKR